MTWRRNAQLFAVAVALTLYCRFFETDRAPWEKLGRAFPNLEPAEVVEIELSRPSAASDAERGADTRPILLRHEKFAEDLAKWWIVEPFRFPAFHPRVQGIVYELVDMVRVAEVEGQTEVFSTVPVLRARFKTRSGAETVVEVGPDHPDENLDFCYVRVNGEVFVTRKEFRRNLRASLTELRSRALVPISKSDATRLSILRTGAVDRITIEKNAATGRWRLIEPLEALADREHTETLLDDLNSWAIAEFTSDAAGDTDDLEPYGLSEPRFTVTVSASGGRRASVEIGTDVPEDGSAQGSEAHVYVRHPGLPYVFTASAAPLEALSRTLEEFRSRFVFDLRADEVLGFEGEVLRGDRRGQKFTARRLEVSTEERRDGRVAQRGPYVWQIEDRARGDSFRGDRDVIESLLRDLRNLRVEKFLGPGELAPAGLETPRARLTLELDSGRSVQLLLGDRSLDPLDEGANVYYASRPGEAGGYLVLTRLSLVLDAGAYELRERKISMIESASVVGVEIRRGATLWSLMRAAKGKEWTLATKHTLAAGMTLKPELFEDLCTYFQRDVFRVSRYFPDENDLETRDLTPGRAHWIVTLTQAGDELSSQRLFLGRPVDGSRPLEYYARLEQRETPVFSLEEDIPDLLRRIHAHLQAITVK